MIQHRIQYHVVDEDGKATTGITIGSENVTEWVAQLNKRYRDNLYVHAELLESWDDTELDPDDKDLLDGI